MLRVKLPRNDISTRLTYHVDYLRSVLREEGTCEYPCKREYISRAIHVATLVTSRAHLLRGGGIGGRRAILILRPSGYWTLRNLKTRALSLVGLYRQRQTLADSRRASWTLRFRKRRRARWKRTRRALREDSPRWLTSFFFIYLYIYISFYVSLLRYYLLSLSSPLPVLRDFSLRLTWTNRSDTRAKYGISAEQLDYFESDEFFLALRLGYVRLPKFLRDVARIVMRGYQSLRLFNFLRLHEFPRARARTHTSHAVPRSFNDARRNGKHCVESEKFQCPLRIRFVIIYCCNFVQVFRIYDN